METNERIVIGSREWWSRSDEILKRANDDLHTKGLLGPEVNLIHLDELERLLRDVHSG